MHVLAKFIAAAAFAVRAANAADHGVQDFPFHQHIAHRSTYRGQQPIADWEQLPFLAPAKDQAQRSVVHLSYREAEHGAGRHTEQVEDDVTSQEITSCFVLLSHDELYASKERHQRPDKLALQSPFYPWYRLYPLEKVSATMLVESADKRYDFYAVTDRNVVGMSLGGVTVEKDYDMSSEIGGVRNEECGTIVREDEVLSTDHSWQQPVAVAVSAEYMWIATRHDGVRQVLLSTGMEVEVAALAHLFKDHAPDAEITVMTYVASWQRLYVGTRSALYTLQWNMDHTLGKASTDTIDDQTAQPQLHIQYREWVSGVLATPVLDFAYDEGNNCLWLAESTAIHRLERNGQLWRYGYHQGSPMGNITSVTVVSPPTTTQSGRRTSVWVGSLDGLARFHPDTVSAAQDDTLIPGSTYSSVMSSDERYEQLHTLEPWEWLYFAGNRYLPGDDIWSLTSAMVGVPRKRNEMADEVVLVMTSQGLSLMESAVWTLEEKAVALERLQYPRHDRHMLTSDCGLLNYGDTRTFVKRVAESECLWTSMHAMGEAYSFAVTGSQRAQTAAWRAFEGLEMLTNVTGAYPHYPARSYCYVDNPDDGCGTDNIDNGWHNSTEIKGVVWKGDTSSDQIDGILAALPLIYDLVAATKEQKARVYALIDGITGGIVKNDLYLIDPTTGQPTTWGLWNPKVLNDDPKHYSERGPNSVGILAYLASAYSITRSAIYKEQFEELVKNHGYIENSLNAKIDAADDDNHSDNELISLTYHILFYAWYRIDAAQEPDFKVEMWEMAALLLPSASRTWSLIAGEFSPLWAGVYAGLIGSNSIDATIISSGVDALTSATTSIDTNVASSVWSLRRWALELVTWPIDQTRRWDIQVQPFLARDYRSSIMRPIRPPQERATGHWNGDPYKLQDGDGMSEMEPAVWRLPYFMMRFFRLII